MVKQARREMLQEIAKTKAHRSRRQVEAEEDLRNFDFDDRADTMAKSGAARGLHVERAAFADLARYEDWMGGFRELCGAARFSHESVACSGCRVVCGWWRPGIGGSTILWGKASFAPGFACIAAGWRGRLAQPRS